MSGPRSSPGSDTPSRDCATCRTSLGAYVLGALDQAEAPVVEAHLRDCEACQAERDALAGVVPFLAKVEVEDVARPPSPPGEMLLRRVLDRVEHERRRAGRRRTALVASVAVLALLLGGVVWAVTAGEPSREPTGPLIASDSTVLTRTNPETRLHARLAVKRVDWGTRLSLSLTGIPEDARCRLVAVNRDGRREAAASWHATYRGTATVDGAVAWPPEKIKRFEVVTFDGHRLMTLGWGH